MSSWAERRTSHSFIDHASLVRITFASIVRSLAVCAARDDRKLDRHLLWICRPEFGGSDKGKTDRDEKEGKELAARKHPDDRAVRLAKIFHCDAKDGVANKEKTGQNSVGLTRARAHDPQNDEEHDALEKCFVKLRRMARSQDCVQDFFYFRLSMDRGDDRFGRVKRWVDLRAGGNGALGFGRVLEQLFGELHRPGNSRDATVKFAVDEIGDAAKE